MTILDTPAGDTPYAPLDELYSYVVLSVKHRAEEPLILGQLILVKDISNDEGIQAASCIVPGFFSLKVEWLRCLLRSRFTSLFAICVDSASQGIRTRFVEHASSLPALYLYSSRARSLLKIERRRYHWRI